jgi:ABC-2 type transport system ATP-binding protein
MTNIISIKNFSMQFGDIKAIDDLSFDIKRGETFCLLGRNGRGKTTTIRALLWIYAPKIGTLNID